MRLGLWLQWRGVTVRCGYLYIMGTRDAISAVLCALSHVLIFFAFQFAQKFTLKRVNSTGRKTPPPILLH